MALKNYYTVLGVRQADSADAIKKAYRQLAKKYHPDLNPGDEAAAARMREIGEAWEILGDSEKRKNYDRELSGPERQKKPFVAGPGTAPSSNRPMTQEDFFNMSRAFDGMFSEESIKKSVRQEKPARANPMNPLDTSAFFEQVMGFRGPKKK